jgi:hypothetical protein
MAISVVDAGVPTLPLPVAKVSDQPFWAGALQAKGISIAPVDLNDGLIPVPTGRVPGPEAAPETEWSLCVLKWVRFDLPTRHIPTTSMA